MVQHCSSSQPSRGTRRWSDRLSGARTSRTAQGYLCHCDEERLWMAFQYPVARNQYIKNSPGIFSCIRGCEYRHGMYSHRVNSPKNLAKYSGNTSSKTKIFSCIRASANTGPACIHAKINSPRIFSCMYWFCAGGVCIPLDPCFTI